MSRATRTVMIVATVVGVPVALYAALYAAAREQMIPFQLGALYSLTRQRHDIIDTLNTPTKVATWTERGLVLVDGRTIPLPGLRRLPAESTALTEATREGVEVRSDGHVYGLVRVWHWCGNDTVRHHVVRVDLGRLLIFLDQGDHVEVKSPPCGYSCQSLGGKFGEYGWDLSEYGMFKDWNEALDSPLGRQAT